MKPQASIEDLSIRIIERLAAMDITTTEQMRDAYLRGDIRKARGIGNKMLDDIEKVLRGEVPEYPPIVFWKDRALNAEKILREHGLL